MDLIKSAEITSKCIENAFIRAKIEVEDYNGDITTVVFHKDQDIFKKAIHIANIIGDGHRVVKMEIIYA